MHALFTEIVDGDIEAVRERLEATPEAVALVASGSPKRFAGRSPLMVALISGEFDIAHLLLDHGADVDFFDSSPSDFHRPVLHDAVTAAVLRSRPTPAALREGVDRATPAFSVLERMLRAGADADAEDDRGGRVMERAASDAFQVLPRDAAEDVEPTFAANLTRIFALLREHGQSADRVDPLLGKSSAEYYATTSTGRFLAPA